MKGLGLLELPLYMSVISQHLRSSLKSRIQTARKHSQKWSPNFPQSCPFTCAVCFALILMPATPSLLQSKRGLPTPSYAIISSWSHLQSWILYLWLWNHIRTPSSDELKIVLKYQQLQNWESESQLVIVIFSCVIILTSRTSAFISTKLFCGISISKHWITVIVNSTCCTKPAGTTLFLEILCTQVKCGA